MHTLNFKQKFRNEEILNNVFIPKTSNWKSTEEQNLSVIESGPKQVLFHKIIEQIKQAEEMICLQSFLIQDTSIIDDLVKVSKRGVRVFILDAAETRLNTQAFPEDDNFIADSYKEMINKKFRMNFVHRQAGNLHAKFILIDPKSNNANGILFTGNFNEKPFKENPEIGIKLNKKQTNELFKIFVYHFWEHTTHEQNETKTFDTVKPANKFKEIKLKEMLCTSPSKEMSNLKTALITSVDNAVESISFSTFGLDIQHELTQEILVKIKEGLDVTIFCRPREKTIINHISELQKHGAKVYCHPLIHAKSIVIDDKEAYVFTANFEQQGMDNGFEIGALLNKTQTKNLIHIHNNWKKDFPLTFHSQRSVKEITNYKMFKNKELISGAFEKIKTVNQTRDVRNLLDLAAFFEDSDGTNDFGNYKNLEIHRAAKLKAFVEKESEKLEPIGEGLSEVLIKKVSSLKNKKGKKSQELEIKWIASNKIVIHMDWANSNKEMLLKHINTKWSKYKNKELYGK